VTRRSIVRPFSTPAATIARRTLERIGGGGLARLPVSVRFWDGSVMAAEPAGDDGDGPAPTAFVRSPRALAHVMRAPGELGLGRAWVDGSVATDDDLERFLRLRTRMNAVSLTSADRLRLLVAAVRIGGPQVLRRPPIPAVEARVDGDRHSRRRDRTAVRYHYDVSNDFYRLLLGPSLVYSCAYFAAPEESLEEAQARKLDLICRKLDLRAGERMLDIGCGWGSLVIHAAAQYGVHATGITLSEPQAQLARERAAAAGVADRVTIRVADYRELAAGGEPPFDKLSSVGMYEHVGLAQLPGYARIGFGLLRPGGLMLNHGIARLDDHPSDPRSFVARYVFPDGELHPLADLVAAMQTNGFEVRDVESLREHYPLTLRRWSANLRARRAEAEAMIGSPRTRVWEIYMAGATASFDLAEIGVYQVLAARPDGPIGLPLERVRLLAERPVAAPA
jgi:cyclopropane-fatty-acyl-phospholipid synthase